LAQRWQTLKNYIKSFESYKLETYNYSVM